MTLRTYCFGRVSGCSQGSGRARFGFHCASRLFVWAACCWYSEGFTPVRSVARSMRCKHAARGYKTGSWHEEYGSHKFAEHVCVFFRANVSRACSAFIQPNCLQSQLLQERATHPHPCVCMSFPRCRSHNSSSFEGVHNHIGDEEVFVAGGTSRR